ncbi:MAG TPA: hypothetical protein VGC32_02140 [Solirubrobacterales bacterium]
MTVGLVEAVAALLVVPAAGLPGAAAVGIAERADAVLADYPHYVAPLQEALRVLASADDLSAGLADLERSRPDLFAPLLEVVVGAWALSEPVWEALGYEGQRDLDPADHPIPEELFQPLLVRGPRWRQPPEVDR